MITLGITNYHETAATNAGMIHANYTHTKGGADHGVHGISLDDVSYYGKHILSERHTPRARRSLPISLHSLLSLATPPLVPNLIPGWKTNSGRALAVERA